MLVENKKEPAINWEKVKESHLLKQRSGDYVIYKVDYLLDNLAREIYLLEATRK